MIRLVSDATPEPLSVDDARDAAKAAFFEARAAQAEMVAHLYLTKMLAHPGTVTYARLKGMRHEARGQVERARAVLAAVERSIDAMERAALAGHTDGDHTTHTDTADRGGDDDG